MNLPSPLTISLIINSRFVTKKIEKNEREIPKAPLFLSDFDGWFQDEFPVSGLMNGCIDIEIEGQNGRFIFHYGKGVYQFDFIRWNLKGLFFDDIA